MNNREIKLIKSNIQNIKKEIHSQLLEITDPKERELYINNSYKKFDIIYEKFGQETYLKYVPKKYQDCSIDALLNENRYVAIYNKHGEKAMKHFKDYIQSEDIEYESGNNILKFIKNFKWKLQHYYIPILFGCLLTYNIPTAIMSEVRNYIGNKQYSSEIELYIDDLKKYADEVKSYNLTNLENIMLVIDDMWNNIYGYGTPNIDTIACLGLDISKENGVGVCRNMSDDIARKLNLINSKYNARVLGTYVDAENFELANIEQKINNEVTDSGINDIADISLENMKENVKESMEKLVGNHAIILMDIPNTDTHLIVDPTNPSIGVFYNGKIIVFNSIGKNGIKEYPVSIGTAKLKGFKGLLELPIDYIKSISSENLEILEQQYGLKAQNDALDKVRSLRNNNKDNEFLLSLKYDVNENSFFKSNTQRTLMNSDISDIDR